MRLWKRRLRDAPVFNPTNDAHVVFALCRGEAIAKQIEADRAAGKPVDKSQLAEAMAHGWLAVAAGEWTRTQLAEFEYRLTRH